MRVFSVGRRGLFFEYNAALAGLESFGGGELLVPVLAHWAKECRPVGASAFFAWPFRCKSLTGLDCGGAA